jgi:hypothetical protein
MRSFRHLYLLTSALALILAGCPRAKTGPPPVQEGTAVNWQLTSTAFANGVRIPAKYTADGENFSPLLTWTAPPAGTKELVLICEDPDAPGGTFTHWVVYGLSPQATSLPEALPPAKSMTTPVFLQGVNDFGKLGYSGPAPPPGPPHRYQFTLYAVSAPTGLPPGAPQAQVLRALEGKVLAQTSLEGNYGR